MSLRTRSLSGGCLNLYHRQNPEISGFRQYSDADNSESREIEGTVGELKVEPKITGKSSMIAGLRLILRCNKITTKKNENCDFDIF